MGLDVSAIETGARMRRAVTAIVTAIVSVGMLASCGSQSAAEGAVSLIEGDFADQNGLTLTDAACDTPASDAVGTEFGCNALSDGRRVDFDVVIDREDHITVRSTNVVYPPVLDAIEDTIIEDLNTRGDLGLAADAVECGDQPVVLDDEQIFVCDLIEPDTGNVFDTFVQMTDLDALIFSFDFAPEPRAGG